MQEEDLRRTMKACGGSIQTSVGNLTKDVLGTCELFHEQQIGGERYTLSHYWVLYVIMDHFILLYTHILTVLSAPIHGC